MNVIKKEMIRLSPKEMDTLMEAIRIFEGIKRVASMPSILNDSETCTEYISDFLGNYCDVDEDAFDSEEDSLKNLL